MSELTSGGNSKIGSEKLRSDVDLVYKLACIITAVSAVVATVGAYVARYLFFVSLNYVYVSYFLECIIALLIGVGIWDDCRLRRYERHKSYIIPLTSLHNTCAAEHWIRRQEKNKHPQGTKIHSIILRIENLDEIFESERNREPIETVIKEVLHAQKKLADDLKDICEVTANTECYHLETNRFLILHMSIDCSKFHEKLSKALHKHECVRDESNGASNPVDVEFLSFDFKMQMASQDMGGGIKLEDLIASAETSQTIRSIESSNSAILKMVQMVPRLGDETLKEMEQKISEKSPFRSAIQSEIEKRKNQIS